MLSDNIGRVAAGNGPASGPGVAVGRARRQRRPTGEPPPLPHPVTISTAAWLVLAAVVIAAGFAVMLHTPWLRIDDRAGTWVLRQLAAIRTPWLTKVANGINVADSGWGASVVGLSVVALAMAFRRWRHLLVFVGGLVFLNWVGTWIYFDQPGTRRLEQPLSVRPQFTNLRFYTFPGGCVTYRFTFTPGASPLRAIPAGNAIAFMPRATLVDYIKNTEDLAICGRGAPCTP